MTELSTFPSVQKRQMAARNKRPNATDKSLFCSGYGQWHSTKNEKDPRPYITITMAEIRKMAAAPPSVAKEQAQWAIFSTLLDREHAEQHESGTFQALWADLDEQPDGLTFDDILDRARHFLPAFIAYTSRSATKDKQKARILVPLAHSVSGADFVVLQKILNDKLQAGGIVPDRATERAGQLCYLPNKGEFYRFAKVEGTPLDASAWADDVAQEKQRQRAEQQVQMERREQARAKATKRAASGSQSPIDAFNAATDLSLLLESFGYVQKGKRWLSPKSKSGVPGVTITDGGKWLSAHSSDAGIGTATSCGTMGDAFDLFVYYEHGGDLNRAVKAAAEMFGCKAGTKEQNNTTRQEQTTKAYNRVVAVDISKFLEYQFPARTNILAPWLPQQGLCMVYAYRGVGKTYFGLNVGYACASAGSFLGWTAPEAVGVLYIDGEMPGPLMQERLSKIVIASNKEPSAPFILVTPDLQPEGVPRIDTDAGQEAIESILTDDIKLIVVDNISTLSAARENEADGWTPVQAWALKQRAKGRSVLFIHHSGKGGAQRGTSRREDVLDTVIALRRPADYQPNDGAVFEVHFEKARGIYGDDVKPIEARLVTDDAGETSWATRTVEDTTYDRVVTMLNDGMKQNDIADELGINKSTVSRHARKAKDAGLVVIVGGKGGEK